MTLRRLTVRGRGPDAHVTFSVEVYQGKVWITSFDCPFFCEALLEVGQADALGNLIIQTAQEARGYKERFSLMSRGGATLMTTSPTAWAYLPSGDCTIRWQRGDNVAYIFEGKQLEPIQMSR